MADVEPVVGPVAQAPKPIIAGSFALYDDENGGFVLVTHNPEQGVVRAHITRRMVKIAKALAGGRGGAGWLGRLTSPEAGDDGQQRLD